MTNVLLLALFSVVLAMPANIKDKKTELIAHSDNDAVNTMIVTTDALDEGDKCAADRQPKSTWAIPTCAGQVAEPGKCETRCTKCADPDTCYCQASCGCCPSPPPPSPPPPSPPSSPPPALAVGVWQFNFDNENDLFANSGSGTDMTLPTSTVSRKSTTPLYTANGKVGGGLSFDGATQAAQVDTMFTSLSRGHTTCMWVKPEPQVGTGYASRDYVIDWRGDTSSAGTRFVPIVIVPHPSPTPLSPACKPCCSLSASIR